MNGREEYPKWRWEPKGIKVCRMLADVFGRLTFASCWHLGIFMPHSWRRTPPQPQSAIKQLSGSARRTYLCKPTTY